MGENMSSLLKHFCNTLSTVSIAQATYLLLVVFKEEIFIFLIWYENSI